VAVIGTGKRVGKTAVAGHMARLLRENGRDVVIVAMGRGGPEQPELVTARERPIGVDDLLERSRWACTPPPTFSRTPCSRA
jgi:cyclic 2,3-diphosphoglycerate synthetase